MRPSFSFLYALSLTVTPVAVANAAEISVPASSPPLLQIAMLLDTSNSMDGLIAQAKTQLWKIVNELALARREGVQPRLQVALYEYGNNRLTAESGFIRQVLPLTDDLDRVSDELFRLATSGGEEYCGHVIREATSQLEWSATADYKAIVIAGNEPFTQGSVEYKSSCAEAIARGILINTIFCGPHTKGLTTGWKDGALLADGSYMNIDQDEALAHIASPHDEEIARLGVLINSTYLAYGASGRSGMLRQSAQDLNAAEVKSGATVQRALSKTSALYCNSSWDLIDALDLGKVELETIPDKDLPEALRPLSMKERRTFVAGKKEERAQLKKQIKDLVAKREQFVDGERQKQSSGAAETFDTALIRALREQCSAKNLEFQELTVESEDDTGH